MQPCYLKQSRYELVVFHFALLLKMSACLRWRGALLHNFPLPQPPSEELSTSVGEKKRKEKRGCLMKPKPERPVSSLRVTPRSSALVSAVMNAPPPRGAACTRARCTTTGTCGTARAATSAPAAGVKSSARGPSALEWSAHR